MRYSQAIKGLDILVIIDGHNGSLEQTKNKCTDESFQNLQLELSTLVGMKKEVKPKTRQPTSVWILWKTF